MDIRFVFDQCKVTCKRSASDCKKLKYNILKEQKLTSFRKIVYEFIYSCRYIMPGINRTGRKNSVSCLGYNVINLIVYNV